MVLDRLFDAQQSSGNPCQETYEMIEMTNLIDSSRNNTPSSVETKMNFSDHITPGSSSHEPAPRSCQDETSPKTVVTETSNQRRGFHPSASGYDHLHLPKPLNDPPPLVPPGYEAIIAIHSAPPGPVTDQLAGKVAVTHYHTGQNREGLKEETNVVHYPEVNINSAENQVSGNVTVTECSTVPCPEAPTAIGQVRSTNYDTQKNVREATSVTRSPAIEPDDTEVEGAVSLTQYHTVQGPDGNIEETSVVHYPEVNTGSALNPDAQVKDEATTENERGEHAGQVGVTQYHTTKVPRHGKEETFVTIYAGANDAPACAVPEGNVGVTQYHTVDTPQGKEETSVKFHPEENQRKETTPLGKVGLT